MSDDKKYDYALNADYKSNLSKTLKDMADWVEKNAKQDKIIAKGLGIEEEPQLDFTEVRKESIKLFVRSVLKNTDDQYIREQGLPAIFRTAIIEIKEILLNSIADKKTISSKQEIQNITDEINNKIKEIRAEKEVNQENEIEFTNQHTVELLDNIQIPEESFGGGCLHFQGAEKEKISVNKNFQITYQEIIEMVEEIEPEIFEGKVGLYTLAARRYLEIEPEIFEGKVGVVVKKTIFEGNDKWSFHFPGQKTIFPGIIEDKKWLTKYQNRLLDDNDTPLPKDVWWVYARYTVGLKKEVKDFTVLNVLDIEKYSR